MDLCLIIGLRVEHRSRCAEQLQEALTALGGSIRLRVGLHEPGGPHPDESGVILLQVAGSPETARSMTQTLNRLEGVHARLMEL